MSTRSSSVAEEVRYTPEAQEVPSTLEDPQTLQGLAESAVNASTLRREVTDLNGKVDKLMQLNNKVDELLRILTTTKPKHPARNVRSMKRLLPLRHLPQRELELTLALPKPPST